MVVLQAANVAPKELEAHVGASASVTLESSMMKTLLIASVVLLSACAPPNHQTLDECVLYVGTNAQTSSGLQLAMVACQNIYEQTFEAWSYSQ